MTVPRILGLGHAVPAATRGNEDPIFDWLKAHPVQGKDLFAGYDTRHVLAPDQGLIDIMVPAAQLAMDRAGVTADDIDMVLGEGSIAEFNTPNTISELHQRLGLPRHAWPVPLGNTFSQFNAGVMMADALIRAGRARHVLLALGDNWTRYVDYATPQSVSAADGAAACVIGPGGTAAQWEFVDQLTIADTSYYGSMFMAPQRLAGHMNDTGEHPVLLEDMGKFSHPFFSITQKGIDGFTQFGKNTAPEAVTTLLEKNGVAAKDICLITHQASTKLMEHWRDVINPGCYVETIAKYANLVECSVLFNLSWGMQNAAHFTQDWLVTLCLGPDMHANAMLMRRNC
ncbi:MAG: 3-oxoacyl-[acyl-carrier-protein] synthase-3 [Paracoccaceae bacterium]|jgi:3-oxoacyl-[acyl-carrier-protein] synthase-3